MLLNALLPLLIATGCDWNSDADDTDADTDTEPEPQSEPLKDDDVYTPETGLSDSEAEAEVGLLFRDVPLVVPVDRPELVKGRVFSNTYDVSQLSITVESDVDGVLSSPTPDADGRFDWSTEGMSPGEHDLTWVVTDPSGASVTDVVGIGVCVWPELEDFSTNVVGNGWTTFGDAYWDPGGWLEVTGNQQSRAGHIYKTDRKIDPGDFRIEFKIATGGGINSGADGYAVNIVNVADTDELAAYIAATSNGGCLGYGSDGDCGTFEVDAFHVEFDTWYNGEYDDPTQLNHVAVAFDGRVEDYALWAQYHLEDANLVWRDVAVQTQGTTLTVEIDGVVVATAAVPGFRFDGGYVGVSGSTGWATNYHRFDDLQLYDRCEVP